MKLFGFQINRNENPTVTPSFVPRESDDGALTVAPGGMYGTTIDLDGSVRSEAQLVAKYRDMVRHPEVDNAVDDIVNEAIVQDPDVDTVTLNLDKTQFSDKIKDVIRAEFDGILKMLNFGLDSYDIFRRWYIDGRIYYHAVIDPKAPQAGVLELRYIDPRKIRKIRELQKSTPESQNNVSVITYENEYFLFNPKGFAKTVGNYTTSGGGNEGIRIARDSVVYVPSGILDPSHTTVISHLHKAIKALNNLRSLEDSVVIYRISRAPERRIFYIDVGNLPKMKAEQYVSDIMTKFKNRIVYDASTGEIRDDRKFMCYALDTKIPLLDGRTLEISQIIEEYSAGKTNWVYSCDPVTGKFVPGPVSWAGVTKHDSEVVRVTFDNGKSVVCTPDHKFPVWGKGFVEAQHLTTGESLIPGYRRMKQITKGGAEYEQIYENDTKTWEFTHREVARFKESRGSRDEMTYETRYADKAKSVVHHKNFNRLDNSPENLVMMNHMDHMVYHRSIQSIIYTPEIIRAVKAVAMMQLDVKTAIDIIDSEVDKAAWMGVNFGQNPKNRDVSNLSFTRKDLSKICTAGFGFKDYRTYRRQFETITRETNGRARRGDSLRGSNEWKAKLSETAKARVATSKTWMITSPDGSSQIIENLNVFCRDNSLNRSNIKTSYGSKGWHAEVLRNHKVISVERLDERMTVAALTIDQDETYHSHHTYLLDAGVYTKNTMLEDFWLPRREGGRGTEISTLPAGQNLGEMADVEYFLRQLYKALNVPVGRLEPNSTYSFGRGAEISRDEDKFAKFITRLRLRFSELFISVLEKQLILKRIVTVDEWDANVQGIAVRYAKDAYYAEIREAEILNMRVESITSIEEAGLEGKYYSVEWIRKNVQKMTEDEVKEMDSQIADEVKKNADVDTAQGVAKVDSQAAIQSRAQQLGVVIDPSSGNAMPPELMNPDPSITRDSKK